MTRASLLDLLQNQMVRSGYEARSSRDTLETYSTQELHEHYYRAVRDGKIKTVTPPVTPQPTHADVEAARVQGEQELSALREQHAESLIRKHAESVADGLLFQRQQRTEAEPRARQIIAEAQSVLRNFALNDANISLLLSVIDPRNMSAHSIEQAIESNAVTLAPPTTEELEQFRLADIERNNERLKSLSIPELRQEMLREQSRNRAASGQREESALLEEMRQRDLVQNLPPLKQAAVRLSDRLAHPTADESEFTLLRRDIRFAVFNDFTVEVIFTSDVRAVFGKLSNNTLSERANAVAVYSPAHCTIVFPLDVSPGTIAHESYHAVRFILTSLGIPLDDEIVAYALGFLVNEIHRFRAAQ